MTGTSGEIGLAYTASKQLSFQAAFDKHVYWGDSRYDNSYEETFYDLMLGLNYTF